MDSLEYFIDSYVNDDDYLMHYGVKGMKWKKRRAMRKIMGQQIVDDLKKARFIPKNITQKLIKAMPKIDQLADAGYNLRSVNRWSKRYDRRRAGNKLKKLYGTIMAIDADKKLKKMKKR